MSFEPIKITFLGEAKTKSNKLFFRRGRTYIPEDIVAWENNLKLEAVKVMAGRSPIALPVKVIMTVYRSNKRKCDLGNFNKSAFDALNGVVYVDDYLICEEHMYKLFDPNRPRIEIEIQPFFYPDWAVYKELPLNLPGNDLELDEDGQPQKSNKKHIKKQQTRKSKSTDKRSTRKPNRAQRRKNKD